MTYTLYIYESGGSECIEKVFEISNEDTAEYIGQQVLDAIERNEAEAQ